MNQIDLSLKKDEELLALSIKKPSAFEVLVDRYQESFLRYATKIVYQKEEVEDVVQDTFVKIYSSAKSFHEVEGASFKSWAYKILHNTALNKYKKLKNNFERFERFNFLHHDLAEEDNTDTETDAKTFIFELLRKLPERFSAVIRKYYIEDKSQKIIAKEEGVSIMTIKMRLFRAKKMFKKMATEDKKLSWII